MTPQRRRGSRPKKKARPTTGSKPRTARPRPASEPSSASTARPSAAPPAKRTAAAGRPATAVTAPAPPARALAPGTARPALPPAEPTLLEQAERLRDDVIRSKLTHPDPWDYTAKARAWGERIQALVQEIAVAGQTPALHAAVGKLATEVEGDADFQKARQLF